LRRNSRTGFAAVAFAHSRNEQQLATLDAWWFQVGDECLVHLDRLHEFNVVEMPLRTKGLGSDAKLIAKRTRESLVRAVTDLERDRQDVGSAVRERSGGYRQPAAAHIA